MLKHEPDLDRVFQALADPTRRAIVERLVRGPASVSQLAEPLPMSLAAVSQHLQVLEASGLVSSEKVGRVRTCRAEADVLRAAEAWLAERRTLWEGRLDRLGGFLTESEAETHTETDAETGAAAEPAENAKKTKKPNRAAAPHPSSEAL
jgi:DNA-binding transcriptional ArsR family regulator